MSQEVEQPDQRSAVLMTMLTIMGGSFGLFILFLVCGGLGIHVLLVIAGMTLFGGLQYILWGRSMSAAVAREQAAEQSADENPVPDRDEAKEWTPEERSWYRRF